MTTTCEKELFIIRGCSGSGKSTLSSALKTVDSVHLEADDFFYDDDEGNYNFNKTMLTSAHKWCQERAELEMQNETSRIVVSNTSTTERELEPYLNFAHKYGYKVTCLVVEHRHNSSNVHNVPRKVVKFQETRLRNSLKLTN